MFVKVGEKSGKFILFHKIFCKRIDFDTERHAEEQQF